MTRSTLTGFEGFDAVLLETFDRLPDTRINHPRNRKRGRFFRLP
jgi:hypothetical protein